MKKIIPFFVLIILSFCVKGQAEFNPFESIGKEGRILTLSNGRYIEVEMYDSLQQIGSVIMNRNTGEIHELLPIEDISEFRYDPTTFSRWYSVDPLAGKFPGHSPYNFVANNPIMFVDPDGRDIEFPSIHQGEDGTIVIEMKITAKMVNESIYPVLNEVHMKDIAERGKAALIEIYGLTGDYIETTDDFGNEVSGKFRVNVTVDLSVASGSNPITANDHVIYIAPQGRIPHSKEDRENILKESGVDMEYASRGTYGYSPDGYKLIYLSNHILNNSPARDEQGKMINGLTNDGDPTLERTLSHEFGHHGLPFMLHLEDTGLRINRKGNLMYGGNHPDRGVKLDAMQLEMMIEEYKSGNLNKGPQKLD